MLSGAKTCKSCRSRQELSNEYSYSNEYLLAKFGFDTAENEPSKVCRKEAAAGQGSVTMVRYHHLIDEDHWALRSINLFLFYAFTLEFVMKATAYGADHWLDRWTYTDLFALVPEFFNLFLSSSLEGNKYVPLPLFKTIRNVRLLRILRVFRLVRAFKTLYMMAQGMLYAMLPLGWQFLMLYLLCFSGGLICTVATAVYS